MIFHEKAKHKCHADGDNHLAITFKPWCMRKGYGSRFVCLSVCLCVCYQPSCYISRLYVESSVPLGFLCCSQRIMWISLKRLFSKVLARFADHLSLNSSLLDELSMDKTDSDGFFLRRLARQYFIYFWHGSIEE